MKTVAVVLVLLCGCDPTPRNKRIASAITLAMSTAALACDAGQTMSIARAGWPGAAHEGNWMLGPEPSAAKVAFYNTGAAGANAGLWAVLPEPYDWAPSLALGILEMVLVAHNTTQAPKPFCGLR